MGKNQAYKAMQRSRVGSTSAQPEEVEDGMVLWMVHFIHQSGMLLVWLVSRLLTLSPGKSIRTSKRSSSKRSRKEKKHKSSRDKRSSKSKDADGPVPLSRFFGNLKS